MKVNADKARGLDAAEITKQDAVIKSLASIITTGNDATNNVVAFTNPLLEGTWRTFGGQKYLFVLNMSSATLTGTSVSTAGLSGISQMQVVNESRLESLNQGSIHDSFDPYQLHLYTTAGVSVGVIPPGNGSSVPEPTGGALVLAGVGAYLMKRRRNRFKNGEK